MHIDRLDLNLLRIFAAVHRTRSVSRAAALLDITQPVASQGLARLRRSLGDALFVRGRGGVDPTPLADRLMPGVTAALGTLEQVLAEREAFNPSTSRRLFRVHLSDIGEYRALPPLMANLRQLAPLVRLETLYLSPQQLPEALDAGSVDMALGALGMLQGMRSAPLSTDRYMVALGRTHPLAARPPVPDQMADALKTMHFVAVRTHADTTRLLRLLRLEERLMLTVEHFTALPAIVAASDLAAVVPHAIAQLFPSPAYTLIEPRLPMDDYTISLYWSQRFEHEPAHRWLRALVQESVGKSAGLAGKGAEMAERGDVG